MKSNATVPNKKQPARQLSEKILREKLRARTGPPGPANSLQTQQLEKAGFRQADCRGEAAAPLGRRVGPELYRRKRGSPSRLPGGSRGAPRAPGRPRAPVEPESRRDDENGDGGREAETRRERSRGRRRPDFPIQRIISETIPGSTGRGLPRLGLKIFRGKRGQSSALRGGWMTKVHVLRSSPGGVVNHWLSGCLGITPERSFSCFEPTRCRAAQRNGGR